MSTKNFSDTGDCKCGNCADCTIDSLRSQLADAQRELEEIRARCDRYHDDWFAEAVRYNALEKERDAIRIQLLSATAENLMLRKALEDIATGFGRYNPRIEVEMRTCAEQALSSPPTELSQAIEEVPQLLRDMRKADVTLLNNNLAAAWALKYWVRAGELLSRYDAALKGKP